MNCRDYQEWLQRDLDGAFGAGDSEEHRSACPSCAALQAASQRLRRGLRLLRPPTVPAGLAGRLVAGVLAERRRRYRLRRRLVGAVALAASVLFVTLSPLWPKPRPAVQTTKRPQPMPSLRDRMAAVGPAVADLTTRALDQAVDDSRVLLPVVDASLLPSWDLPPFQGAANPLRDTGEGMTAALEPLADTARRAFTLFRRELPLQTAKKPEL